MRKRCDQVSKSPSPFSWVVVASVMICHGIFASAGTHSRPRLKSATVKLVSAYNNQSLTYRGSGLAFRAQGVGYVVTSDHVTLHDNEQKSHKISWPDGSSADGEFLVADYGRGLALLKIKSAFDITSLPDLEELSPAPLAVGTTAAMMGYPALSDGLIRDITGAVSDVAKASGIFIQTENLLEIKGGHAEFGMSGGVVSDLNDNFAGILTAQVYSYSKGGIQNTVLAIPAPQVLDWLRGCIGHLESPPVTLTQTTEQLADHDTIGFVSDSLAFIYVDAFGTGRRVFDLLPLQKSYSQLLTGTGGDLAAYQSFLHSHDECQIYIIGFRTRGQVGSGIGLPGPVEEIRWLSRPEIEPITELFCNGTDEAVEGLAGQAQKIRQVLREIGSESSNLLLRTIESYVEFITDQDPYSRSHQYTSIKPKDLERLRSAPEFKGDWAKLETRGKADGLRRALQEWIGAMQLLTI